MSRITQIISHYLPAVRFGGPLQVAHSLGKALVALGHQVDVVTTDMHDDNTSLSALRSAPEMIDGITVYRCPVQFPRYWGYSPQMKKICNELISHSDIVLLHFHYQYASMVGGHIARANRKPYAVFTHGSLNQVAIHSTGSLYKRLYLKYYEEANFQFANFLAFNSIEEQKRSLYSQYGRVIPTGIDFTEYSVPLTPGTYRANHPELIDKFVVIFLGRLHYQPKGLDRLVRAFARCLKVFPQAHLLLVGPDVEGGKRQITALAKSIGIERSLTFTGVLQGAEKVSALIESDLFVLPSRYEGFSVSLLEALALGLPVVASSQVGLCNLITRTGAGIIADSISEISDALMHMSVPANRNAYKGKCVEAIRQDYNWPSIARELLEQIGTSSSLSRGHQRA